MTGLGCYESCSAILAGKPNPSASPADPNACDRQEWLYGTVAASSVQTSRIVE